MIDKMGFTRRERIIKGLFIIGVAAFLLMCFLVHIMINNRQKYSAEQLEVTTCDFDFVKKYKSPYMGDASNIINLFNKLPLRAAIKDFKIDSERLTLQINYKDTKINSGELSMEHKSFACEGTVDAIHAVYENEVNKSTIYDSMVAFAIIDNLESIIFNFTDVTYTITRKDVEAIYGDVSSINNKADWNKIVRDPLGDTVYVTQLAKKLIIRE